MPGSPADQVATLCQILTGERDPVMDFRCVDERPDSKARVAAWRATPPDERAPMRFNFRGKPSVLFPRLRKRNGEGWAIYYSVNRTDGEGRKRANMIAARALAIDLDGAPLPTEWRIPPHLILESSPGKFQCLWAINETTDFDAHRGMMLRLAAFYGGDRSVADVTRVLRLPGFLHQKRKPFRSRIIEHADPAEVEFGRLDFSDFDWLPPLPERERTAHEDDGHTITCEQLAEFFAHLPAHGFGGGESQYADWLKVGMAAHKATGGLGVDEWLAWCATDPRYNDDDSQEIAADKWLGFDSDRESGVGVGTLYHFGKLHGVPLAILAKLFPRNTAAEDFADDREDFKDSDDEPEADAKPDKIKPGLTVTLASEIEPEPIKWLWQNRIALGKLTIIAGFPDAGKSQITISVASIVSNGDKWPNNEGRAEQGSTLYLSSEDDAADTIVPRLKAAGADMDQVSILSSMVKVEGKSRVFNLADDLKKLGRTIADERAAGRDVRLVIIDPISAYVGGGSKGDSHKNTEMRAMLTPLTEWAAEHGVAVIAITHFNKSGGNGNALYRVTDSLAFTAAARTVWLTATMEDQKVMVKGKNNIGRDPGGLAYSIEGVDIGGGINAPRIVWGEAVDVSADEALATPKGRPATGAVDAAADWLERLLADGPKPVKDVKAAADAACISEYAFRKAKARLGVVSARTGFQTEFYYSMPGDDSEFG
jgi:hypothetical protein